MYQHKLVPEGATKYSRIADREGYGFFHIADTIPLPSPWTAEQLVELGKITLEEWDEINIDHRKKYRNCVDYPFSQYLSDLLSLAPLKGLSKEQIEEIYDHFVT